MRVVQGVLSTKMKVRMMAAGAAYTIDQVGILTPYRQPVDQLTAGEVGYIIANIRHVGDCKIGDTITSDQHPAPEPLPGFKPSVPVVFCSFFPDEAQDFERLRDALTKLNLNDAVFLLNPRHPELWDSDFDVDF